MNQLECRITFFLILLVTFSSCASTLKSGGTDRGEASYYASKYHGKKTASGERFDMQEMTGAHRTLPFGSKVKITSSTGKSVVVRINDRGPFVRGRIIDVSVAAAKSLGFYQKGVDQVEIEVISTPSQ